MVTDNAAFQRFRYLVHNTLSPEMLTVGDVEVYADHIGESLRVAYECMLWGEDVGALTVQKPAGWVEAVKERWLPEWMRRWWPVRYDTVTADVHCLYPDFKPAMPDERHAITVHRRYWEDE